MKFKVIVSAAFVGAATTMLAAEEENDTYNPCHSLLDNDSRLYCYDKQTNFEGNPAKSVSSWVKREQMDPLTDAETSLVYLEPKSQSGEDAPDYFIIHCNREGGANIYMETDGFIGSSDRIQVSYRWAGGEVVNERWLSSTTGKGAFLPAGYKDFRSGLEKGGDLVFEWTDFRGSRSQASWSEVSLNEDAKYVLNGCGN